MVGYDDTIPYHHTSTIAFTVRLTQRRNIRLPPYPPCRCNNVDPQASGCVVRGGRHHVRILVSGVPFGVFPFNICPSGGGKRE